MRAGAIAIAACLLAQTGRAAVPPDSSCSAVPGFSVTRESVAFTETQENDLGDAIAEHLQHEYRVIHDDSNAYLRAIGGRLLRGFPPTSLAFRFTLVNGPDVNAFVLPGGRVYVTRKLVAFTRSEDELAGVIAHEIGHVITRDLAADLTRRFRETLRVTSFGDRKDVFEKYHRLVETWQPFAGSRADIERDQHEADRVAVIGAALAGYSPSAYVEFFDRLAETGHRAGSFLTRIFGFARPETKRLGELLRSLESLPPSCRGTASPATTSEFAAWRETVIAAEAAELVRDARSEAILSEQPLQPPLRDDLVSLSFSPDGRYVLAQADGTVFVLTRAPFAVAFTIETAARSEARFTPDSRHVVLQTSDLRVELWDVAGGTRSRVHELTVPRGCLGAELSPDATLMACEDGESTLRLLDVATSDAMLTFEHRIGWNRSLQFSPDGRYLVAGEGGKPLIVDLAARRELEVSEAMRRALRGRFAFIGPDRVVVIDDDRPDQSAVIRFPSGESERRVALRGRVSPVARGNYLLVRPIVDWPAGLVDLESSKVVWANGTKAMDVYDDLRVSERRNGELALYPRDGTTPLATVLLPKARLEGLSAAHASSDLQRLALSGSERGGVWEVATGRRQAHIIGFQGGLLTDDGALYAVFPEHLQVKDGKATKTSAALERLAIATSQLTHVASPDAAALKTVLFGRYLVVVRSNEGKQRRGVTLHVSDVTTGGELWTRRLPNESLSQYVDAENDRVMLMWGEDSATAARALRADRSTRKLLEDDDLSIYAEVLDARTGRKVGAFVAPWRLFRSVVSAADSVVLSTRGNVMLSYSLATGAITGRAFGRALSASAPVALVCVANERGELQLRDLRSLEVRGTQRFASDVTMARFSADGQRLLVVTADQVVRVVSMAGIVAGAPAR